MAMFPDLGNWYGVKDGDMGVRAMLNDHYSGRRYKDGRVVKLSVGPGEKMLLKTSDGLAIFIWRKFIDASGQQGINCAAFRNIAPDRYLSSDLIREACDLAWRRWPGERLYTYVNPRKVKGTNPGYCFERAGWHKTRDDNGQIVTTKGGLLIFEITPIDGSSIQETSR